MYLMFHSMYSRLQHLQGSSITPKECQKTGFEQCVPLTQLGEKEQCSKGKLCLIVTAFTLTQKLLGHIELAEFRLAILSLVVYFVLKYYREVEDGETIFKKQNYIVRNISKLVAGLYIICFFVFFSDLFSSWKLIRKGCCFTLWTKNK